jgi:hypothetical protein
MGTSGRVLLFEGTRCLDDFGARGAVGDIVGLYSCGTVGAPTQSWTFTTSGS